MAGFKLVAETLTTYSSYMQVLSIFCTSQHHCAKSFINLRCRTVKGLILNMVGLMAKVPNFSWVHIIYN